MKANYLTLPEVSSILGVNPRLVSSWLEDGSLVPRRLSRGMWGVATLALVHLLLRKGMQLPHRFEGSVRMLVIDDEPAMLRSTARLLKRSAPHLEVRLATGALEGLREVEARAPDLVLLDMYMPELTGTELCARLKQQPSTAGMLVIGFSGRRDPALEADFARAGAVAVLDKPPDVQQLLQVLERSSSELRA